MESRVTQEGDLVSVVLQGDITIQNITPLKELLLKVLRESASIRIDVTGVTHADLSFVQLLCAAHRQARSMEKPMIFEGCSCDQFLHLAAESGYARDRHCSRGTASSCFWKREGQP